MVTVTRASTRTLQRHHPLLQDAPPGRTSPLKVERSRLLTQKRTLKVGLTSSRTEEVISEPSKFGHKFRSENVDICYPPVFQSGGIYDLRPSAQSNDDPLYYDAMAVIICALGARYLSYCSNIARTFLIDADSSQEKAYKTLLEAHQAAINALRPNVKLSAAYEAALAVFNKKAPELVPYLTRNAGTGIGIEFRESALALSPKNERTVKPGMVFNVALGLQKLANPGGKDAKTKEYSLLLSDTVVVREKDAEVATASCTKEFSDIAYSFKDDDEEDEEAAAEDKKRPTRAAPPADAPPAKAFLRSDTGEVTKEAKRKEKQAELAKQKNDETYRRLAAQASGQTVGTTAVRSTGDIQAYRRVDDIPTGKELMIEIDERNEAVLLPIYGLMVPFHISTIKSVSNQIQQDGAHAYIRINFNVPGTGFAAAYAPAQKYPDAIFLREVSFRSNDVRHSAHVVQLLKTTKRMMAQRETEKADRATLVTQEKLMLAKGRPITLPDLSIRPSFPGRGKKLPGALEGHANGFRYVAGNFKSGERLDIMYRNIKHAFFQPAQNNLITLLHFHLHHPIMVGNKKTKDVQLYTEVREGVESLDGGRRSMYDPDEIEEEQRERERRNKVNTDFQQFVRRIQELWEKDFRNLDLEFDIPFRELGFPGVSYKSTGFIMPTVNCLVELIEMPFLVITLNEVEIVNLERVGLNVRNFDMVIVFKDFKKDPAHIDAIPTSSLDTIKDWLNSMNIKYYENRLNLNWKEILRTITSDPEHFIKEGGWEFLNMDASDESASSDESSGYAPTDEEEEDSDSSEEDSEDESVVDSDEEGSDDEDSDEEEEEGLTWDELEAQAKKADRERDPSDDSDDERQRRKVKARPADGGRGPPPKRVRR
ncbi:hypothetical protein CBR_g88540 [Chara braunii]|uniref:FACT complex subunit n=1 Tax=Chara braunii TaxID=69332 RepID=A0A388KB53_CHABU|nr:hypothetical protein CBR_g88540 [Chara braunii]|eukprot:GBG67251.1 hypothetical protein CBR_g88540 [Chara braunii]